jgi:hypothetical protein
MATKNKFNVSMFEKIKDALKKSESTSGGSFSNIMKFPAGHTYTIRLIPNVDNIDETFFHHYVHQWMSLSTGKFISALSLQTFGETDPIANLRWKLYKDWKENNPAVDAKGNKVSFKSPIDQKEQWFVNAYWVDNPATPELNGTVQILKMGPQLKEIVDAAMTGEDADEFGAAIFDLSKNGCDFKIKAEEQGPYTTFKSSRFSSKTRLDLDDEEIDKIYESVYNLKEVYPIKTVEELNNLLDEHFFCSSEKKSEKTQLTSKKSTPIVTKNNDDDDDEIPMEWETSKKGKNTSIDDDVDDIIAGLDLD